MAFPKIIPEINALLQIWAAKIDDWATLFGLSPEQVTQIKTDAPMYNHLILATNQLDADRDEYGSYRAEAREGNSSEDMDKYPVVALLPLPVLPGTPKKGIEIRNKELYNFFKNHPNRTPEALADLGITDTPKPDVSPDSLAPNIGGKAQPDDTVALDFDKQGQAAARFRMRRDGGSWEKEFDAMVSPVIDKTASAAGKPEKREYQAIYLKGNVPFGQWSQILTIYTTP